MGCFFKGHDWVQIAKTVSPAPKRMAQMPLAGFQAERMFSSDLERLLRQAFDAFERDSRSVTCFLFQCSVCKTIRKEELWGTPEELLIGSS